MFASDMGLIHNYMAVSSVKSLILDLTFFGRSFMYAKTRMVESVPPNTIGVKFLEQFFVGNFIKYLTKISLFSGLYIFRDFVN